LPVWRCPSLFSVILSAHAVVFLSPVDVYSGTDRVRRGVSRDAVAELATSAASRLAISAARRPRAMAVSAASSVAT
jgi:hypothetical protein